MKQKVTVLEDQNSLLNELLNEAEQQSLNSAQQSITDLKKQLEDKDKKLSEMTTNSSQSADVNQLKQEYQLKMENVFQ